MSAKLPNHTLVTSSEKHLSKEDNPNVSPGETYDSLQDQKLLRKVDFRCASFQIHPS